MGSAPLLPFPPQHPPHARGPLQGCWHIPRQCTRLGGAVKPPMPGISIPPQVKQENKQLKRLSLAQMPPPALPQEEPPEEDPDPAQCYRQQLEGEPGWGVLAQPQPERVKPEAKPRPLPGCPVPLSPCPLSLAQTGPAALGCAWASFWVNKDKAILKRY